MNAIRGKVDGIEFVGTPERLIDQSLQDFFDMRTDESKSLSDASRELPCARCHQERPERDRCG